MDGEEDPRNGHGPIPTKKPRLLPDIRQEFAHHLPGIARINNGSFGCCPESVLAAQRSWQLRFLRQPDHFYVNALRPAILRSRALIKDLVNADHIDEISLLDNATTAAAVVLHHIGRSFSSGLFRKDDTVLIFHCAFQAVKKSIQAYVARAGGSVVEIHLPFPVHSPQQIVSELRKGLERAKANGSSSGSRIREEGVDQVFVDAAHALGTVPVDVKEIGADFYVSNLHKWFFCPPSVAFFYCRKSALTSQIHHPVVTHEYGNGLPLESSWIGTRDYSSQLLVPSAVEFVNRFEGGIEGIMKRNHEGVVQMGKMLAESWGTILGSPPHMCASMIMVALPSKLGINSDDDASRLRSHLRASYGVEVPIYYQAPRETDGAAGPRDKDGLITGYARISHQVYNTVADYHKFRDAVNQLVENGKVCGLLLTE